VIRKSAAGWLLICSTWVMGCGQSTSVPPVPSPLAAETNSPSTPSAFDSASKQSPNYSELFDTIVLGSHPDATNQQEEAGDRALKEVVEFNEYENQAFVAFLQPKLGEASPYVRMEAASHLAMIRKELGAAEANRDLIPLFVELLRHDDLKVREYSLINLHLLVEGSELGNELAPLVQPLIEALQEPVTTYHAMSLLGGIGPPAKGAISFIQRAAERDNDTIIDNLSVQAIRKIERGEQ